MNQKLQEEAEKIFSSISIVLTETGYIYPTVFVAQKSGEIIPIVSEEAPIQTLCSAAVNFASENDSDALMFICEQSVVSVDKSDPRLEAFAAGLLKPSEEVDAEDFLTLIFMSAEGECKTLMGKIFKDLAGTRYTKESKWLDKASTNIFTPWRTNDLQYLETKMPTHDSKGS
jgi:hypothetical protein